MKRLILLTWLAIGSGAHALQAQEKFTEKIQQEIPFSNSTDNTVIVKNVFGSIAVEGHSGSEVLVMVEKKIKARSSKDLQLGKEELVLGILQEDNRIVLHPDSPYFNLDRDRLEYNWRNNSQEPPCQHEMNFTIKVPNRVQVHVSTVNNGEIMVANTKGSFLRAENINGGITLNNITGKTVVNCINGAVNISYGENPQEPSKYHSLNGDINISYQRELSANISFKSMNGEMFTDFDINKHFMKTNKEQSKKAKYRFESKPVVQIGNGQVDFDFETLNGNVFIKKI